MANLFFPILLFHGCYRPVIPVKLTNPATGQSLPVLAWIDSGADSCIFPSNMAEIIGHNLTKGDKIEPRGYGSTNIPAYLHTNNLLLVDGFGTRSEWRSSTYFSAGIEGHGLLGLKGFFSHFKVDIDYRNRIIILREY